LHNDDGDPAQARQFENQLAKFQTGFRFHKWKSVNWEHSASLLVSAVDKIRINPSSVMNEHSH